MSDPLSTLTQAELLALALEASRRGDSGHALVYLKEAARRSDASARALFMLGSEYAQLGLASEAKASMSRAVEQADAFPLAHFQLGMLHVVSGENAAARAAWAALDGLASGHAESYLLAFRRGMQHLMADEFDAAVQALREGVAANRANEPLNADMRRVIDAIEHLPGRQATQETAGAALPPSPLPEPLSAALDDVDAGHLFISAYTQRGKPH
ncbi:tetratricopeptide (TPR) repeat protein [Pelomonas saccharophila]|uniref:Tetratricopeptide (TPR) repeat protein n=1 Tax=Roseateles saccharophilus TaxID=304 RepID=A0ABU1YQU4_ROSSA|nr:hypothetical protein [Roseateles saccharophilus]MDR7271233.1 tetratricopeptide (TPR) repeat protein [Roseateles saccharophilus]